MGRLSIEEEVESDEEEINYVSRVTLDTPPRPRQSFHRNSSSLTSVLSFVNPRKSFSYDKLDEFPLQLTVVKLDGSSFEVEISKTAKIAEVKQAIENKFNHLPTEGPGKISWPQVWGHFCLSYGAQKLLNDSENIKDYGIKDGDELHFVRHLSIDTLKKKRSKKRMDASRTYTILENEEEEEQQQQEEDSYDLENLKCLQPRQVMEDNLFDHESEKCNLFGGWFGYSRVSSLEHPRSQGGGFVGFIRRICLCCGNRPPTYSSRVSQVEI